MNIHLDFSKAFSTVSCSLLVAGLKTWGLEKRIAGWVENWLGQQGQQYHLCLMLVVHVPQGLLVGPTGPILAP